MNALTKLDTLDIEIKSQSSRLQMVLPKHMSVDKFIRVAMIAAAKTPSIMNADRTSLFTALERCAADGLVPDGREAALIEFKNTVQYMPMIDGVLKRLRQSGEISTITARVVYQGDSFDYWVDEDGEHLKHRPKFDDDRGDMRLVYAMAKLKDGSLIVETMTLEDVNRVRASSKTSGFGPWKVWYDRMALKSVMHRLARRLPNSSDAMEMLDQGNFIYDHDKTDERDITPLESVVEQNSYYPEEDFTNNFSSWEALIKDGMPPERVIAKMESRGTVTDEQRAKLEGVAA